MLLRSSSTPLMKKIIAQSSAAPDSGHRIPSKPVSLTGLPINKLQRTSSDGNTREINAILKKQELSSSPMGSPDSVKADEGTDFSFTTLSLAGDGGDNGGMDGPEGFGDWGQGKQMDEYYENMIKTFPGETLLLTNYAKFLKEVRGDLVKAEEYCERAILVNPDDGETLSMYGDLIWSNHGDGARAQSYFSRAIQASPNDCNVHASYARYLWTSEEDDEEEEVKDKQKNEHQIHGAKTYAPQRYARVSHGRHYLAAAS
ncbi:hypothetical protein REPUB_Repub03eG0018200 [Reevesia pubescens]